MSFECIPHETYELTKTGNCMVGTITKKLQLCSNTKIGAKAISAPSVSSFLNYLQEHCPYPQQTKSSSSPREGEFYTLKSYEEAYDIYVNRPHEIRKFKPEDEILAVPDEAGKDVYFDLTGDFIDIQRAITGEPESFGNFSMGNPRNLFATIVMNTMIHCTVSAKVLETRAHRLMRLVDWLENQQVRVQVKLISTNECGYMEIMVKEFDQYLDLDGLAVASHPDFFRRMSFRFFEWSSTWQYAYGTSCTIDSGRMKFPDVWTDQPGLFLFTENHSSAEKVNKSYDEVHKQIKEALIDGRTNFSATF